MIEWLIILFSMIITFVVGAIFSKYKNRWFYWAGLFIILIIVFFLTMYFAISFSKLIA